MIVTLTITSGEDQGKTFRLTDGETKVVGRGSKSDIILRDACISRQHSRFRLENGGCYVMDMGSRNGTAVNGRKISEEVRLADDDLVEFGTTKAEVRIRTGPELARPAAKPAPTAPTPQMEAPTIRANFEPQPPRKSVAEDTEESVRAVLERRKESAPAPSPQLYALQGEPGDLVGRVIGGCRAEEMLTRDEISHVYRATQISMDRPVALKVLAPGMTKDNAAVERFIAAARAGGKLSHPNIVQVYDAGEENGIYFIALEFIGGSSVRRLLVERGRNRPLPLRQAVEIAEQIAGALAYAHAQTVIHRSVSPDTVLVTSHGIAKLANLGFLQNLEDSGLLHTPSPPRRPGDLPFIAPEQLADERSATAQSDLYSLGAVLFMMVTGQPPFRGTTEKEIVERVIKGERETVRRLQRDVPEDLAQIIERALAKSEADRFLNASELRAALQQAHDRLRA